MLCVCALCTFILVFIFIHFLFSSFLLKHFFWGERRFAMKLFQLYCHTYKCMNIILVQSFCYCYPIVLFSTRSFALRHSYYDSFPLTRSPSGKYCAHIFVINIMSHCVTTFYNALFYCFETIVENIQWKMFHLLFGNWNQSL